MSANKAVEAFLTVASAEARGKPVHECVRNPEVLDLLVVQGDETVVRGTRSIELIPEEESRNTSVSVFQSHGFAGNEEPVGQVLCFRDNSRLKNMEVLQSEFVDSVAHELRTPLTSIRAYVEMLIDDEADQQTKYDFYNVIYEETHRLSLLIDNLLNISMLESGVAKLDTTPTRLKRLLEESLDVIRPQCEKKDVKIVADLGDRLPTLDIDKNLFGVAIMNILGNAAKYTPAEGTITLSTSAYEEEYHVEIRDTGVGISEKDLSRIFEKFYRASTAGEVQGSGVGLATALQVIRLHGGDIRVNSKIGEGSVFTIVLPRALINTAIGD